MQTPEKQYNVLLLMTDQHRFDVLGCMGNPTIETPNLDRIAAEGTVFRTAYTACPSCIPARAILMTGMNQWHTGILGMGQGQSGMGTNFKHTIPGELDKAGYYTKGVGKMHFFPQRSLNGFHHIELDESRRRQDPDFCSDYEQWFNDHKDGDYGMSDGRDWNGWEGRPYDNPDFLHPSFWTVDRSIQFLKDRDRSKPFFLKTSFARPHSPYDALPEYFEKYDQRDLPMAAIGDWAHIHDDKSQVDNPAAWHGTMSDEQIHNARAGYYGNVDHIDVEIGRLLNEMERQGILDDTLILFTADHGDMLGDHNMWRKTYAYEGSAHIPMLVRLPKDMQDNISPESDKPVMLRDIMPTILDVLGLNIPDTVDGLSMLPLAQGKSCEWRDFAHGEHCTCYSSDEEMQYLADSKVKYIWFPRTGREQLFDLENDPYELCDLANSPEHEGILVKMRRRLIKELEPRNCGLTDGDKLIIQSEPITSPHYIKRLAGMPEKDKIFFRELTGIDPDNPEYLKKSNSL
jgi:choline-sulfatase